MKTVLVLLDSLNRHYLKTYNRNAWAKTPNLDAFAEDSVVFDNHFIGSAPCMPARRDLFTGRLGFLERNWGPIEPFDVTLPQTLRKNKVYTHIVTDHTHYFEIGGENYCCLFDTWQYERGQEFDTWISRVNRPPVDEKSYGKKSSQYLLNRTTFTSDSEFPSPKTFRSASSWVEDNRGADNFFLMVEAFDPHEPFDCPREFLDMYGDDYTGPEFNWSSYAPVTEPGEAVAHLQKCYAATLTMADKWFGRFIDTLKSNNMYDDTLIIVTTDHGHILGEHGFTGKNFMHAYNELAHIPLMVRLPGGRHSGVRIGELTQNIDVMPTVLKYHGCEIPQTVKGQSLLDVIEGTAEKREAVLYGWFGRAVNVYDGRYTYFRAPQTPDNRPCFNYCAMPTTIWRYFGPEYAKGMEMGRFLKYTDYPVYKIPVMHEADVFGDIKYVSVSELYDIKEDYPQKRPLEDKAIEAEMAGKLVRLLEWADSPDDQYIRLGLGKPGS